MARLEVRVAEMHRQGLDADFLAHWFKVPVDKIEEWIATPELPPREASREIVQVWKKKEREWAKYRASYARRLERQGERAKARAARLKAGHKEWTEAKIRADRLRAQIESALRLKDEAQTQEEFALIQAAIPLVDPLDKIDVRLLAVDFKPPHPRSKNKHPYIPPVYLDELASDIDDVQISGAHNVLRLHDYLTNMPAGYLMSEDEAYLLIAGQTPSASNRFSNAPLAQFKVCSICGWAEEEAVDDQLSDIPFLCDDSYCREARKSRRSKHQGWPARYLHGNPKKPPEE